MTRSPGRISAGRIAVCGLLTALALLMGYVESLIPLPVPVPGVRIGLANIVILAALYLYSVKEAAAVAVLRAAASAALFGNMISFVYSAGGLMAALLVMTILKKTGRFSVFGVSAGGGAAHMAGQMAAACLLAGPAVLAYLPVLLISGTLCGFLIGAVSARILSILSKDTGNQGNLRGNVV